ncbi:MAG TPA: PSD1 and planctomycete cytochrome C domain-containing protein [Gemmataceae bacterium]|nr:PSD1 and planctomycete cytochrome C domain-containing protein [Gemmataceae bacterium]
MRYFRLLVLICLLLAAGLPRSSLRAAENSDFFENKVRPLLVQHCYRCHSGQAKKLRGGLRLDSREALLAGGDSGPALVPGNPAKSRLIVAVAYKNIELQMPPRGQLSDAALADLTTWVKMGAPWPKQASFAKPGIAKSAFDLQERKRTHWAWQPIRPQSPPSVRDAHWPRDPLDRFILSRLDDRGLSPAKPADRRTLLRRLYFDLIGLPPSPEEVQALLDDSSSDAVEKVVDRLLSSPHFGERWGRHWLDLVRYAETRGHEFDYVIPNAHHYRDYVVRALNADVPYNQFVVEHLAGDLLPNPRPHPRQGFNESILGTGFWFLGEEVHSPVDIRQDQADRFDNKVDVLSKAFLGMTVACARCHDHKFDAISTKDYYSLFGFLQSSHYRLARFDSMEHNRAVAAELWELRQKSRGKIQKALAAALRPGTERLADNLLAAREAMLASAETPRLGEIAKAHKLDATILDQWISHLKAAARDVNDPLHLWAKVMVGPASRRSSEVGPASRRSSDPQTIIDYAHCKPEDWLTDGFAFGPGPVRVGELHIRGAAAKPALYFSEYAAAEKDPTWDVLKLSPGAQNDPGALGGVVRAGRTLRTPTFPLTTGKVFYLVKGSGFVYAAVGSHVMIAGPLHGQLVRTVNTGERFQWIEHNLSTYQGQRIHLEFTPSGSAPFAVAQVASGGRKPPDSLFPRESGGLRPPLADADSLDAVARSYQDRFLDTLRELAADRLIGSSHAVEHARLANWMIGHAALFGSASPAGDEARAFLIEQGKIAGRIQKESRLCVAMIDGSPENEYVFIRGSHKAHGETVPRRFLEALASPAPLTAPHGSGRLELARQMIDPDMDPFLPRVLVNRVWHHLFGRGIVASTDNFGVLGERPTHPELLDYLADRFIKDGWSIKKLIRTLVLSSTYRMSSQADAAADRADPGNLLLHRMRRRRLEGEAIRDAMLMVSGRLDPRLFGPSVLVHLTEFQQGRGRPASGPLDGDGRRSVYLAVRRNFLSPFLLAFDTPSPFSAVGRRTVSNVPAQSLILLNDPFVHQQAQLWAKRMLSQCGSDRERIVRMYESAFARPPTAEELAGCLEFLQHKPAAQAREDAIWADLAHVLFNVKEFIFVN